VKGRLALAWAVYVAGYYALFALRSPQWTADAALILPAAAAAFFLARRARREQGRVAWFFGLQAMGAATWAVASGVWTTAALLGYSPGSTVREQRGFPLLLEALFLAFLLPMVAGMAVRPHPPRRRRGLVARVDVGLIAVAITYSFLRLSFLPLIGRPMSWRWAQGLLWLVLALWAGALWRMVDERRWRHTYGAITIFALTYPCLAAVSQALGRLLPPGGPSDLAWIVPFYFLALAGHDPGPWPERRRRRADLALLLCGLGLPAFDGFFSLVLPAAGLDFPPRTGLLLTFTALLTLGCAVRLWAEGARAREMALAHRSRLEEERRGERLGELGRLATPLVPRIESAVEEVVRRVKAAAGALGDKAERALEQATRAREVVGRLSGALLPRVDAREEVDLAALLERCVHEALEEGPALNVALEGLAALPPVLAAREALGGCFVELIRNAAQASPGGTLRVSGDVSDGEVVLRFLDDGPGIGRELLHRVFEPFFTTRQVGEGFGLGLTRAHFVARAHGGAVTVEPVEQGGCVAVHLQLPRPLSGTREAPDWPLVGAVAASAAAALVLVLVPAAGTRLLWSVGMQIGASLAAGLALAAVARSHHGQSRRFWALLAAGPALWSLTRALRVWEGGLAGAERGGVWHFGAYALAELCWVLALLARPDRPRDHRRSAAWLLGAASVFCLCTYVHFYLVLLPGPFGVWDPALRQDTALWRGALRLAVAVWAVALALRATTPYWRGLFARLSIFIGLWGAGQAVAGFMRSRPDYAGGALTDLGWIVPPLLLAGFALGERTSGPRREVLPAAWEPPPPLWTAAALLSLAALPAFDALMSPSAHPELDLARRSLTWVAVVAVGGLLAAREYFTHRAPIPARRAATSGVSGADPERTLKVVAAAVYELAGHLSGITALTRLVLTQSDASGRVRGDSERIQIRADMAARIARNLIALLQGGRATPELASVNRLVEEVVKLRAADLEHEGVRVVRALDPHLPAVWWVHAPAVRQALLCCLDAAAVALRTGGRTGSIELATAQEGDELVVRLRGEGQGLPRTLLTPLHSGSLDSRQDPDLGLSLAREIVAHYGGSLTGRYRGSGGAELVIRMPMASPPSTPDAHWMGLGTDRSH
jgi:signal transduction histidine kinase